MCDHSFARSGRGAGTCRPGRGDTERPTTGSRNPGAGDFVRCDRGRVRRKDRTQRAIHLFTIIGEEQCPLFCPRFMIFPRHALSSRIKTVHQSMPGGIPEQSPKRFLSFSVLRDLSCSPAAMSWNPHTCTNPPRMQDRFLTKAMSCDSLFDKKFATSRQAIWIVDQQQIFVSASLENKPPRSRILLKPQVSARLSRTHSLPDESGDHYRDAGSKSAR